MKYVTSIIKMLLMIICYPFISTKYKGAWLICERGTDARDNGYHFFKYICNNHPEIKCFFCIDFDSPDYNKVKKISDNIIMYNSLEHMVAYFASDLLISTHAVFCCPSLKGVFNLHQRIKFNKNQKCIFLQHGIIPTYIKSLTSECFSPDVFICGAKPEYDFILSKYGHRENVVNYTGLARYDNLTAQVETRKKSKKILLMPTWRMYFKKIHTDNDFIETEYYKEYNKLISDPCIISVLDKYDYELIFYPHYEAQKWISTFRSDNNRVTIASFAKYDVQQLLIDCDILITDYSSVFFDFAYMRKPIFYFHFDYELYSTIQYNKGYYDYKNGFGPLCNNVNQLAAELNELLCNGEKQSYINKKEEYFIYHDTNNCERIYTVIRNLYKDSLNTKNLTDQ